jgi:hypothetical protein
MEHRGAVETLASERYILGEMSEVERDAFEEHFFSCQICADDVLVGDRMRTGVRAALAKPAAPVVAKRRWQTAVVIPWAAAATLALVAGYQTLRPTGPGGTLTAPMALAPMTLRPATRGEAPTINAAPGGVVTLAIDLGAARYDRSLTYQIRSERGELSGSGSAAVPSPGAPLLLLIPSSVFGTSGRYTLTLGDAGSSQLLEYNFVVKIG